MSGNIEGRNLGEIAYKVIQTAEPLAIRQRVLLRRVEFAHFGKVDQFHVEWAILVEEEQ